MNDDDELALSLRERVRKLKALADIYGCSISELIEVYRFDSIVPGICINPNCECTDENEPDQSHGFGEDCGTETVASAMVLAGLI